MYVCMYVCEYTYKYTHTYININTIIILGIFLFISCLLPQNMEFAANLFRRAVRRNCSQKPDESD